MTAEAKEIRVLDTNILIRDPTGFLDAFRGADIVVPISSIEEIDDLKRSASDHRSFSAREVSRRIENLRSAGSLSEGVRLPEGGTFRVYVREKEGYTQEILHRILKGEKRDNEIIADAFTLHRLSKKKVVLVSGDLNVRIKANALGLRAENYTHDEEGPGLHGGLKEITVSDPGILTMLSENGRAFRPDELGIEEDLYPNQCLRFASDEEKRKTVLALYVRDRDSDRFLIKKVPKPKIDKRFRPRNDEQALAYALGTHPDIKITSLVGKAGTGKTLMALKVAWDLLRSEDGNIEKIVVFRPANELGNQIGSLPGTADEKFEPWKRPVLSGFEIIHREEGRETSSRGHKIISGYINAGTIEILPINFIQGDTFHNCVIVVDEAQNYNNFETKMIVTRAGEGSKMILTGDLTQVHGRHLDSRSSGLTKLIRVFQDHPIAGHLELVKGERSELATLAASLL